MACRSGRSLCSPILSGKLEPSHPPVFGIGGRAPYDPRRADDIRPYKGNGAPCKAKGFVGERTSSGVNEPWHLCRGERYRVCEDEAGGF